MEQIKTILGSYRHISLEPVFLLFCVNLGLIGITTQDLYLKKACKVNLNHTEAICDNIFNHTDIQVYNYYTHLFDKISLQPTLSFPARDSEVCQRDPGVQRDAAERPRDHLHPVRGAPQ